MVSRLYTRPSQLDIKTIRLISYFMEEQREKVNHPRHYTWLKDSIGIEVIDITRLLDFDLGNAIKYILRAGRKQEEGYSNNDKRIEDLRKAVFYLNDEIEHINKPKQ